MAGTLFENNLSPYLTVVEQGSTPANPSAGDQRVFIDSADHLLKLVDSSGTVTTVGAGTGSGSITSSGYTQTTARLLGRTTAATGAIEEITVGTGLSLSAGSLTATGGLTQAYVGYNTIGGSSELLVTKKWLLKKITLANDCLVTDIEAYIVGSTGGKVDNFVTAMFADNAGSPRELLNMSGDIASTSVAVFYDGSGVTHPRWFGRAVGKWCVAADYWIGVSISSDTDIGTSIYYDATGSDHVFTSGGAWVTDAGFTTVTTGSNQYSIRANTIR